MKASGARVFLQRIMRARTLTEEEEEEEEEALMALAHSAPGTRFWEQILWGVVSKMALTIDPMFLKTELHNSSGEKKRKTAEYVWWECSSQYYYVF
ncbi:hypothetical protein E2C01_085195 [Portunus trituberculatus]|uniref:Uncharacterized protein n=1 Tax=Portunus trituberculatus TaxID=210409 RepID=A0A5B7IX91_PORTR|nr:hypothetical protein [Portunus trituberculatus]